MSRKQKDVKKVTWTIPNFPKKLKDTFLGLVKAIDGKSGKERVTELVEEDILRLKKKQKQQ